MNRRNKPCLGYPSQKAAIAMMAARGLDSRDIARRARIPLSSVQAEMSALRRSRISFSVSGDVARELIPQAIARGITPGLLAQRVLENVLNGNLVAAVLDDVGGQP